MGTNGQIIGRLVLLGFIPGNNPAGPDRNRTNPDGAAHVSVVFEVLMDGVGLRGGGWGEIRTHGTLTRTAVFKTAALNRSATHPDWHPIQTKRTLMREPCHLKRSPLICPDYWSIDESRDRLSAGVVGVRSPDRTGIEDIE